MLAHFEAGVTGLNWNLNQVAAAKAADRGLGFWGTPQGQASCNAAQQLVFQTGLSRHLQTYSESKRKCCPKGAVLLQDVKSLSLQIK